MRTLGNILWHFPFFGFLSALSTFLVGGLLFITLVGTPIGLGLIQLAKFFLAPFTHEMVSKKDAQIKENKLWKNYGIIIRIIYFPFGLILALITIIQIAGLFVSLIGIPVALVLAKSLRTYFNPVGKICIHRDVSLEIRARKAKEKADKLNS
ncbi:MAG: YccF domain-containing protein [Candidatus Woesearchaeota archaeon]